MFFAFCPFTYFPLCLALILVILCMSGIDFRGPWRGASADPFLGGSDAATYVERRFESQEDASECRFAAGAAAASEERAGECGSEPDRRREPDPEYDEPGEYGPGERGGWTGRPSGIERRSRSLRSVLTVGTDIGSVPIFLWSSKIPSNAHARQQYVFPSSRGSIVIGGGEAQNT